MVNYGTYQAHYFLQWLRIDIQNFTVTARLETYLEVIEVSQSIEHVINKKKMVQASSPRKSVG